MIVNNSLDEVKKRENALSIIKNIIETKGRNELYDLTGLSGGFIASSSQLSLLMSDRLFLRMKFRKLEKNI